MTSDRDTIERLRAAMAVETEGHHVSPGAAGIARENAARRRPAVLAVVTCLLGVLGLAGGITLAHSDHRGTAPGTAPTCALDPGALPGWANAGFSPDAYRTPHVLGRDGTIIAIPFANPLRVHPAAGTANKILWVSKDGSAGPLRIRATLGDRVVTRAVDLGPSSLDLPAAGCWHLQLTWPGHHDTLALGYRR